jgi:hypothetical protein
MAERKYADEAREREFRVEVVIVPVYRDACLMLYPPKRLTIEGIRTSPCGYDVGGRSNHVSNCFAILQ